EQARTTVAENLAAEEKGTPKNIETFRHQLEIADAKAERAVELAAAGIPGGDGDLLLQRDPRTRGREVFKQHCATRHGYVNPVTGADEFHKPGEKVESRASNLFGFARVERFTDKDGGERQWGPKDWIRRLLKDPDHGDYFGRTPFKGGTMTDWVL